MAEEIYYQWQNEHLLKTIYPLREMKLRDFLVYYYEIDIWAQYKDKKPADIQGEIRAYIAVQRQKLIRAVDRHQALLAYFIKEDVTDEYLKDFPELDPDLLGEINEMHRLFKRYFPTYKNPAKEKYFLSERIRLFEEQRRFADQRLKDRQRALRNMPSTWSRRPAYELEVARLTSITPKMFERELSQLYDFLTAIVILERHKTEFNKVKAAKEKELADAEKNLRAAQAEVEALIARQANTARELARFNTPPKIDDLKRHFSTEDVSALYRQHFPDPDQKLVGKINESHRLFARQFPTLKNPAREKAYISEQMRLFANLEKETRLELADKQRILRNMGPNWAHKATNEKYVEQLKSVTLKIIDAEINKWSDFQWTYELAGKTSVEIAALKSQKEKEQAEIDSLIKSAQGKVAKQRTLIAQIEQILGLPEKDQLLSLVEVTSVSVKDIVRGKVEDYQHSLSQKTHDQLLEDIVQRFLQEPDQYPLWLQYMVIHFSGMRYQSAHGSWADPKDLLSSLRIKAVENELKRAGEDAVNALSEQKYATYQSPADRGRSLPGNGADQPQLPKLALTSDTRWQAKIEHHLKRLHPSRTYGRRKALLDLRIDEENYEIEKLTEQQALDELELLKDDLPAWMWKEIVRLTNLRLKKVKDAGWEQLTPEEADDRYAHEMWAYNEVLNNWKKQHLTGWREEHDRSHKLVVTRAVCNEVAEHIQHLRGHTPPGGLTAKPEWYLRKERDPRLSRPVDKPYLSKAMAPADFKPGASILWLRWVNSEPNAWRITRPLTLKNGEGLLPREVDSTGWSGQAGKNGNVFTRTANVTLVDDKGKPFQKRETQWLRWIHEATVVEVAETADGPTVLTFETALPYEDRRQSTIGVFKHVASNLRYFVTQNVMNGSFVGYIPEGNLPYPNLKEMLDWNRILRRKAFTPAEIASYWMKVTKPETVSFSLTAFGPVQEIAVETAPRLRSQGHQEVILCYEPDRSTGEVRIYRPEVALKRGTILRVNKEEVIEANGDRYFLVTHCIAEPRAQDLYVREDELIQAPDEQTSRPVMALAETVLWKVSCAGENSRPVFEPTDFSIPGGTKVRVSKIHKLNQDDAGDGLVCSSDGDSYYLIVACPRFEKAEGLFIKEQDCKPVTEKQYLKEKLGF
jgi:hypothetical protein